MRFLIASLLIFIVVSSNPIQNVDGDKQRDSFDLNEFNKVDFEEIRKLNYFTWSFWFEDIN